MDKQVGTTGWHKGQERARSPQCVTTDIFMDIVLVGSDHCTRDVFIRNQTENSTLSFLYMKQTVNKCCHKT